MARTEGVEPSSTVLETVALPLNYIRIWCSRRDLNSYAIKHQFLRLTCLPLPSQEQKNIGEVDWIWTSDDGVADRFLNQTWIQLHQKKWLGYLDSNQGNAGVKVLCLTSLATSQYIWWAEQDLNLQCILRHGFTVRLLQPICISTQNGAECKIRTYGPHNMNDRLATWWFKPLTQLSVTLRLESPPESRRRYLTRSDAQLLIGVVSGLRTQNR